MTTKVEPTPEKDVRQMADLLLRHGGRADTHDFARFIEEAYARLDAERDEVRRLRALPVLRTCADCKHHYQAARGLVDRCRLSHRALPLEDVVPDWCELRGKATLL